MSMSDGASQAEVEAPIRTILFDLSDVLVVGLTGLGDTLRGRLPYTATEILAQFRSPPMSDFLLGSITEDAYLRRVMQEFGWDIDLAELKNSIRRHFDQTVPGMVEIVAALAKYYPLYLLSDHGREWIEYIESRHVFLGSFSQRFYSFSLHTRKNNPTTYRSILPVMGCDPHECLFIDDRHLFLDAANEVGLQTILFRDSRQLLRDLRRFGITLSGPAAPPRSSS